MRLQQTSEAVTAKFRISRAVWYREFKSDGPWFVVLYL